MILVPLSVLMLLFNLKLTGVIFWLWHLRVNLLWFLKLASFLTWCSHFLNVATLSLPNSFLIILCRFLILFSLSKYDTRSIFSLNRINSYFFTSFHQVTYSGFLKCEGKWLSQHQVGTVLENVIIYKIILFNFIWFYLILFDIIAVIVIYGFIIGSLLELNQLL